MRRSGCAAGGCPGTGCATLCSASWSCWSGPWGSYYYWRPRPRVGDAATVVYDPASPDAIVRDVRIGDDRYAAWVGIGLVVALGSGGGVFLWRTWPIWRENAEDWRSGRHFA